MTSDAATSIYQAVILNHNRRPIGYGDIENPSCRAEGFNPICGDKITVTGAYDQNDTLKIGFTTQSCALCRASASVMTASLSGKSQREALNFVRHFENMLKGLEHEVNGDAAAFSVIRDFPARAKCVLLPWRVFNAAISQSLSLKATPITTETVE